MIGQIVVALIIVWAVIWAAYGFTFQSAAYSGSLIHSIKEGGSPLSASSTGIIDTIYQHIHQFLIPGYYFKGLSQVLLHVDTGHDSFLLGMTSHTGWWYYFPVLILTKTPLPTLLIFIISVEVVIKRKEYHKPAWLLTVAAFLYLFFAMLSKTNIGLRHVLPFFPLLYVAAGYTFVQMSKRGKWLYGILIVWLLVEMAVIYPFYLSYFNEIAGGTYNGYKVATDSNYDWGQEVKRIQTYLQTHELGTPYVAYFWDGEQSLDYYGIKRRPLEQIKTDRTGYVIIGASILQSPEYSWIKDYPLTDRISPALFVYRLN